MGVVGRLMAVVKVLIGVVCDVFVVNGGVVGGFVVSFDWGRKVW